MAQKRDYYEVLGISREATDIEIKKAYRTLAKKYHPDVNPGDQVAEANFKEVNEAYSVLIDPEKRQQYNQFGHAGSDGSGFGGSGFGFDFGGINDIFETFFGGGFGGSSSRKKNGPRKGADIKTGVELKFEEAAFGTEKELTIDRMEACDTCRGSGSKSGSGPAVCKECNGTGQIQFKQKTPFGQFVNIKTCDACNGEGKVITNPCEVCRGSGRMRKVRKIKVKVPAGIDDAQTISLRGEGEPGYRGGPSGDLFVNIRVRKHPIFGRQGNDVVCEMPITFVQGALGSEIDVPTLDGKIKHSIPEGTQTGTVFKIKGKGIPDLRSGARGDHYIKVNIEVPTRLSTKQKELLKEFAELSGDEYHEQRKGFFNKMKDALGM